MGTRPVFVLVVIQYIYDAVGNPINYREKTLVWTQGTHGLLIPTTIT